MTKKRFTIAPDLASGLRDTIQSASTNQGQMHYDMMSIDVIERDPQNPRKLNITLDDIINGLSNTDSHYQIKLKDLESLQELGESIKRVGVRNAIEVYKDGLKYRLISGERRYLASILMKQKTIPTRIIPKPDEFNLRYIQWVENINRQDLSLKEKYYNLLSMASAHLETNGTELTEGLLQNLIGISSIQAYRYFSLLKAESKIIDLVISGKLNNLKLVQELVTMKDKGAREQILSWIRSSKNEVTTLANFKLAAGKKNSSSSTINLGKIQNTNIAKYLIETVLSDDRFNKYNHRFTNIDWASSKSISRALKDLLNTIDKELSDEEIS